MQGKLNDFEANMSKKLNKCCFIVKQKIGFITHSMTSKFILE